MELYHHIADTKSLPFGSTSGLNETKSSIDNIFVEFYNDINEVGLGLRDFTIDEQMICIISALIFYFTWLLNKVNKQNNSENIEMQPSFDLVIDQREIYGNNGLLLSLKRSGDVYKLGLCEFINDTLEYHSPNHRQIEGEIEEIEKKIIRKFIANSSDYDFNHINRCWHKKESNKSYFNHVKQILHTMLYQSVYSFQTYLLSVNETTTTINWDIFTTVRESLYARANHLRYNHSFLPYAKSQCMYVVFVFLHRRNIIRPPVAAAFNVRLEVNYFADEKTPIHSHKRVKPFEIITVDQYIPQYKCKSLKEPNKILLSLLSCMLTNYRPEIMGCKEAKEKAQMVQSHGIVIVETMQERIMNRMEFVIFSNIDTNFDFVVSDTYNLLWIDFYFGTTRDCGPCFCVAIVRFDFNVV